MKTQNKNALTLAQGKTAKNNAAAEMAADGTKIEREREAVARLVESFFREKRERARSAWQRGVAEYGLELAGNFRKREGKIESPLDAFLGAENPDVPGKELGLYARGLASAQRYSEGGFSLIFSGDIAKRLCSLSELRKKIKESGEVLPPSKVENWCEVQSRAIFQAFFLFAKDWADILPNAKFIVARGLDREPGFWNEN